MLPISKKNKVSEALSPLFYIFAEKFKEDKL